MRQAMHCENHAMQRRNGHTDRVTTQTLRVLDNGGVVAASRMLHHILHSVWRLRHASTRAGRRTWAGNASPNKQAIGQWRNGTNMWGKRGQLRSPAVFRHVCRRRALSRQLHHANALAIRRCVRFRALPGVWRCLSRQNPCGLVAAAALLWPFRVRQLQ